jgi:anti-sigma B factor antagonist
MEFSQTIEDDDFIRVTAGAESDGDSVSGNVDLDIDNNYVLEEYILEMLEDGNKNLILDLCQVPYCDSSGLSALFEIFRSVTEAGGVFKVYNPTADVHRVLEITKFSKKIEIITE